MQIFRDSIIIPLCCKMKKRRLEICWKIILLVQACCLCLIGAILFGRRHTKKTFSFSLCITCFEICKQLPNSPASTP
ncbi:hypothetical protein T12_14853 [Trichinella patagoniensis]|uniref:Uncharacterized protein n=1 Tax=Trichinella patagoniensis TaxID=990121 RepID=A0A0V0ZG07_9BILA|nr:hypothetical protein T12_14853 [Trichinella patagoniensis]